MRSAYFNVNYGVSTVLFDHPYLFDWHRAQHRIHNAQGGYLRIYSTEGWLEAEAPVTSDLFDIPVSGLRCGVHLLHLYYNGTVLYRKILVP